jgi:hypothetical protein
MNLSPVLFGIEAEIGITRDDDPELNVAEAAAAAERRQKVAHSVSCGSRCEETRSPRGATEFHPSLARDRSAAPPGLWSNFLQPRAHARGYFLSRLRRSIGESAAHSNEIHKTNVWVSGHRPPSALGLRLRLFLRHSTPFAHCFRRSQARLRSRHGSWRPALLRRQRLRLRHGSRHGSTWSRPGFDSVARSPHHPRHLRLLLELAFQPTRVRLRAHLQWNPAAAPADKRAKLGD